MRAKYIEMEEDTESQLEQLRNLSSQLYTTIAKLREEIDGLKHIILMLQRAAEARDRSYESLYALHLNLINLYNNKYK